MHPVLIVGAGKIGSLIAMLLTNSKDYQVYLADLHIDTPHLKRVAAQSPGLSIIMLDARDPGAVADFVRKKNITTIVSALPFYCNPQIIKIAKELSINYFDLTEDTQNAIETTKIAQGSSSIFVPQCGLAPGFISIVANHLMKHFPQLDTVKMRVGALPLNVSNPLQYSLTWSTDGLINEYGNFCEAIENGQIVKLPPLENIEEIEIDGTIYEAFNTSGGIGSLAQSYEKNIKHLNYKTIRYPGHCAKMRFLMFELKLNDNREILKNILENVLPKTDQDIVLVYVSVTGIQDRQLCEENYVKKFYSQIKNGIHWSAIQLSTASALCAVLDIVTSQSNKYHGLVLQEQFSLGELTANRFGKYFST